VCENKANGPADGLEVIQNDIDEKRKAEELKQ